MPDEPNPERIFYEEPSFLRGYRFLSEDSAASLRIEEEDEPNEDFPGGAMRLTINDQTIVLTRRQWTDLQMICPRRRPKTARPIERIE